ncbi:hypothetical protein A2U01_0004942, partial [Trifolium medium]|nr:hypothetical protein [Trifolium medium]
DLHEDCPRLKIQRWRIFPRGNRDEGESPPERSLGDKEGILSPVQRKLRLRTLY